ncbi:MAG TPA: SRPBCC family protein [Mycobacteriales bacterium]|jgi:hypothetical protein
MTTVVSRVGESGPRPDPDPANDPLFDGLALTESVDVTASAEAVYALVTDVTRIGELSPECVRAEWVAEGVFEGTNRIASGDDEYLWVRPCTVVADEPGRHWAYVVGDKYDGTPATRWDWEMADNGDGTTTVTQTFSHLPHGLSGVRSQADADPANAAAVVAARVEVLRDGMRQTLARLREAVQRSSA